MLRTTITSLVCLGITFGSTSAIANDTNSANVDAFELTNIQFLRATGANGYRFDNRQRRDDVKSIIEARIESVRQMRLDIVAQIRGNATLTTQEKVALWGDYAQLRTRLASLYADRRGVLTTDVAGLDQLEVFYAPTVSAS